MFKHLSLVSSVFVYSSLLVLLAGTDLSAQNATALNFDGVNDVVAGPTLNVAVTNRTLSAWVRLGNNTQSGGGLVSLQTTGGATFDAIVYNETNQGWGFGSNSLLRTVWSGVQEAASPQWVHIAATYANNDYRLYRNGVQIASTTSFGVLTYASGTSQILVGQRHTGGGGAWLNASIDDVTVWNRVLTPTEIQALMTSSPTPGASGLLTHYKFDNGIVNANNAGLTSAADNSGNGRTGTLTNFALTGSTSNWTNGIAIFGNSSVCVGGTTDLSANGETDWTLPTGGTITTSGNDYIHTFSSGGTFATAQAIASAQVLVVAGGGGGGNRHAGGGGAGGYIYNTAFSISSGSQSVTVGNGGTGSTGAPTPGTNGFNSVFSTLTAFGGGGGSTNGNAANSGGSGGGGSNGSSGAAGTPGQGNAGGSHAACCFPYGAGGGGAGAAAANVGGAQGSAGGVGLSNSISGSAVFYAGGGGGGADAASGYAGGNGGGGAGGSNVSINGSNGTANTGGGGGGGGANGGASGNGGAGGSGVVIVRYTAPRWTSSNAAVATVNAQTGLVTAVSAGTVTITYTSAIGATASSVVTVLPLHTMSLTSAGGTNTQTVCPNAAVTNITYSVGGGATSATVSTLPAGVTSTFSAGVLTIGGAPTTSGTYGYTVTSTGNSCTAIVLTGTITVRNQPTYANLQFPSSGTICPSGSHTAYGRVYAAGVTEAAGAGAGIVAQIGYSTSNTDPSTWTNWSAATFNVQSGNDDEYTATLSGLGAGTYYYTFRYSLNGCAYVYGGFVGGFWNGTSNVSGVLTVNSNSVAPTGITGTTTICGGASTVLTLSGGSAGTGATAQWFSGSCGGTSVGTGNSITVTPSASTSYFVRYAGTCNTTTCASATVGFETTPPVLTCPANITVSNTAGSCSTTVSYVATATDNCGATTITYAPASGSVFNVGLSTVTVTARDAANNQTTCTFTVRVNDTQAPVITCALNVTISNTAGLCTGTTTLTSPTVTDNCQPVNNALNFDGTNDLVAATGINIANQSFTIEFWAKPTNTTASGFIVGQGITSNGQGLHIGLRGGNTFTFATYGNDLDLNSALPDTDWHHWACVFTAAGGSSTMVIYRDGVQVASRGTSMLYSGTGTLHIGTTAWGGGADFFNGSLDELRIWNVARNATQISNNRNLQLTAQAGLLASYSFNHGVPSGTNTGLTSLTDASGNSFTGTLSNFALTGATSNWVTGTTGIASPSNTVTVTNNAPATYAVGTTTVTWTATDAAGNASTCTQTVRVNDTQAPSITCPANITVSNTSGACTAAVTFAATVTDNCATTITYSPASGSAFSVGLTTVTATAVDAAGNSASCTFTVRVNDTQAPSITCPTNITVSNTTGACNAAVTFTATATDNCGATITYSPASGSLFSVGLTTVTATAADAAGNSASCTFTVLVNDTQAPAITCASNVTISNTLGLCTGTTTLTAPMVTDNCTTPGNALNFDGANDFVSVPHNANLALGSPFSFESWIYIQPTTELFPTIFSKNGDQAVMWLQGGTVSQQWVLAARLGGAQVNTVATIQSNTWAHVALTYNGTTARIYINGVLQASGSVGVPSTGTQTLLLGQWTGNGRYFKGTIDDVRIWNIERSQSQIAGNMNAEITSPQANLLAYYNLNQGLAGGNNTGITTATDISGNNYTGTLSNFALSGSSSNWTGGRFGSISNNAPTTYPIGTTTVTWTATDAAGNASTCAQTVSVNDTQAPVITCPANITVSNTVGACTAAVTFAATATDICGATTVTYSPASGSTFNLGLTTVTATAVDAAGNAASCTFTVLVNDTQAPSITCPTNITVSNTAGACTAAVTFAATATDICGATTITYSPASGSSFNTGLTTVTATAVDAAGNSASCTFTVRVDDTQAPTITCAANVTQNAAAGLCNASVTVTAPTITDNCQTQGNALNFDGVNDFITSSGNLTLNNSSISVEAWIRPNSFTNYSRVAEQSYASSFYFGSALGANAVSVWLNNAELATTAAGTIVSGQWQHIAFTFDQPTSVLKIYINGVLQANVTTTVTGITANLPLFIGKFALGNSSYFDGTMDEVRVWNVARTQAGIQADMNREIAINTSGLLAYYRFNQGIADGNNTTVTTEANLQGTAALNGTLSGFGLNGATSNFVAGNIATNTTTVTNSFNGTANASGTYPVGTTTVTWTATDAAGNASTCTQTVSVNDTQAPVITCPANITMSNVAGACTVSVTYAATATDNCGATTITYTPASGSSFSAGLSTVTATAVDAAGNSASCTFTVSVNDTEAPSITCPANITVSNTVGTCTAAVTFAATATDNCGATTITYSPASGSTFAAGLTMVTATAVDAAGNSTSCTFTVHVNDTQAPSITCPANITVSNTAGACNAAVTFTATATDNCGATTVTYSPASGSTFNLGLTTVTSIAVDAAGNSASCTFTVRVNDTEAPVITCAPSVTINNTTGLCTGTTTLTAPTVTENCGDTDNALDFDGSDDFVQPSTFFTPGTSDFTIECWIRPRASGRMVWARDQSGDGNNQFKMFTTGSGQVYMNISNSGNSNEAVLTSTVGSVPLNAWTHVSVVRQGVNHYLYVNGTLNVSTTRPSVINCTPPYVFQIGRRVNGEFFNGTMDEFRIWNVARSQADVSGAMNTQLAGNESGLHTYYRFNQGTAAGSNAGLTTAIATTGPNATLTGFALTGATSNWVSSRSGVPVTVTNNAPATYAIGTTTVTWTATDAAGNASTCTQTVRVNDAQAPSITCPANITVSNTVGACNAAVTFAATATDICGATTVTYSPASGSTFNLGLTTVTATAVDAAGNSASCTFTVRVNDTQAPSITPPSNITLCGAQSVSFTGLRAATATDNCGATTVTYSPASGSTFSVGTTTVTATATDAAGNASSTTFVVTINPSATVTFSGGTTGCGSVTITASGGTGYAWSGGTSPSSASNVFTASGTFIVTVTNASSCSATAQQTVVVNTIPTVTISGPSTICAGTPTVLTASGATSYVWSNGTTVPPLDNVSSSASLAVGLRKLRSAYSGNAVRIRRVTDNVEQDFGFVGNDLDVNSISTFLGGAAGYVTTLYDQSGNGRNLVQPTQSGQPLYVANGLNGKPVLRFTVSHSLYNAFNFGSPFTAIYNARQTGGNRGRMLTDFNSSSNWLLGFWNGSKRQAFFNNWVSSPGGTPSDNNPYVYSGTLAGSSAFLYENGVQVASGVGNSGPNGISMGAMGCCPGERSDGEYTDLFVWQSVLTNSDRLSVENNSGRYYGFISVAPATTTSITVTPSVNTVYAVTGTSNGCSATASFGVTVNSTPAFTSCPSSTSVNASLNSCTATVAYTAVASGTPAPTYSYAVTGATSLSGSGTGTGSVFNRGVSTVVISATNSCGVATCTFNVTVNDTQAPVITCPANMTVTNVTPGVCTAAVTFAATATDNCGATITYSHASGSQFNAGLTTVTVTAVDAAGNASSCTFTVRVFVNDTQAPSITCPANITVSNTAGACTAPVTFAATATDNCGATTITYSPASGSTFNLGLTTVTVTAVDVSGNSASCTFTVRVNDTQAPSFGSSPLYPAPAIVSGVAEASQYNVVYGIDLPTGADWNNGTTIPYNIANNVSALTSTPYNRLAYLLQLNGNWVWVSMNPFTSTLNQTGFPLGNTVFQQTVTNMNVATNTTGLVTTGTGIATGNIEFWSHCYSQGTGLPGIGGNGGSFDFNDTYASADCWGSFQVHNWGAAQTLFSVSGWSNNLMHLGIGNQTSGEPDWTFNNNGASFSTRKLYVLMRPTTGTSNNNITVTAAAGQCTQNVTFNVTASDNCGTPTVTYSHASGSAFNTGITTVTATATDGSGNSATTTFTITVLDNQAPSITCPANITVSNTAGSCSAAVTYAATATDNCGATTITYSPASGSTFNLGLTTVTATAVDASGNAASCTFTVSVNDTEAPVITCAPSVTISNTPGLCSGTTTLTAPTVTDNCSSGATNNALDFDGSNDFVSIPHGAHLNLTSATYETWVRWDGSTNIGNIFMKGSYGWGVGIRSDGIIEWWQQFSQNAGPNSTGSVPVGTWTHIAVAVTNGGSVSFYINGVLSGTSAGAAIVNNSEPLYLGRQGHGCDCNFYDGRVDELRIWNVVRTQSEIAANMNAVISSHPNMVGYYNFNQGTANGSNGSVTQLLDNTTNANNGTLNRFALTGTTSNWVAGTSTAATFVVTNNAPATYPIGTTTVTWTATDAAGNASTCTQTVHVNDTQAPSITCPANITVSNAVGTCSAVATFAATATDNCGATTVTYSHASGSLFNIGLTTVSVSATDASGNQSTCSFVVRVNDVDAPLVAVPANITRCGAQAIAFTGLQAATVTDACGAVTVTYSPASGSTFAVGTTTVTVTGTDVFGNTATGTFTVTINAFPGAGITGVATACEAVSLTATGGTSYAWSGGATPLAAANIFTTSGTYIVTVTDANTCSATASQVVTVNVANAITVSGTNPACVSTTLTASGAQSYVWSTGSLNASQDFTVGGNTSYTVTGTDGNGCTAVATGVANIRSGASNAALATGTVNGVSLQESCTENGWTYYVDPANQNQYIFAIEWGTGNDVAKNAAQVSIDVTSGLYGVTAAAGAGSNFPTGTWVMPRSWNVNTFGNALNNPVRVRFYHDPAEVAAANAAAAAFVANHALSTQFIEPFTWFKTVGTTYTPGNNITANGVYVGQSIPLNATYGVENQITYAQFDNVTSFSGGSGASGVGRGNPLPLTLEYFMGERYGDKSNLSWLTQTETNTSHFVVQRSLNGSDFSDIGQVQAAGNSATPRDYAFVDEQPAPGNNYYRLRLVDLDGAFTFSNVIVLNFEKPFDVSAYPNPFSSTFTVDVYTLEETESKIEVFDMSGRLLDIQSIYLTAGTTRSTIDGSRWTPGAYLVKVTAGGFTTHRTIVKTKF